MARWGRMGVVVALVACAAAGGAQAAAGVQVDPGVGEGELVTPVPQPAGAGYRMALFSPDLVGVSREAHHAHTESMLDLRATTDGSALARIPDPGHDGSTTLSGRTLLRSTGEWFEPKTVTATDAVTGEPRWAIEVPTGERLASVGESWVLSSTDGEGRLRRPGRPDRTVEGLQLGEPTSVGPTIVGDAEGLLVTNGGSPVWVVDLETATTRTLEVHGDRVSVVAGPTRWFVVASDLRSDTRTFSWWNRAGDGSGSVTVPGVDSLYTRYLPYGDGLAHVTDRGRTYDVEPVDLSSGATGAAVVAEAWEVRALGDGRLVAGLADTPNGRIAVVEDGQPLRTLVDLPDPGRPASAVFGAGGHVVTGYGRLTEGETWSVPVDGGVAQRRSTPAGPVPGEPVAVEGDTVLTLVDDWRGRQRWTLSWPGGSREVAGESTWLTLHPGGRVVTHQTGTKLALEDARTGASLGPVPTGPFAVDGTTTWVGPDADGRITARNLLTGTTRSLDTGAIGCGSAFTTARGRWLLVPCGSTWRVVDLSGILRPWTLAVGTEDWPVLGAGVATWTETRTDPSGTLYRVVVAQDLGASRATRAYGPVQDRAARAATDAPWLTYLDDAGLARVARLGWLTAAPSAVTDDRLGPRILTTAGSPSSTNKPLFAAWTAEDLSASTTQFPSGVASYDLRYQQPLHQKPPTSSGWLTAAWSLGMTADHVDLPAAAGKDTCWAVRARDRSGNVGAWSVPRCVTLDTVAPSVATPTVGPRIVAATTKRTVTFSFQVGVDGQDWSSTDSAYRVAVPGSTLGPWLTPSAWAGASAQSQRRSVSPGEDVCFRARARDSAGNVGSWSTARCAAVPFDDRALSVSGSTARSSSSKALTGTVTVLKASGAKVSRSGQTGTKVALIALRGPGQGTVDVYVGSRKVGRVSLAASTWSRTTVTLSTGAFSAATVSVRSVSKKSSSVDALAVLRS